MPVQLIFKQLAVHRDLAIGVGTVAQQRGPLITQEQQIELTFIFRSLSEIRALDICRYTRVQLHQPGCNLEYWFDDEHTEPDDGFNVLKPDTIPAIDPGRWRLVDCGDGTGGGGLEPHELYGIYHSDVCTDGPATSEFVGGEVLAWDAVKEKWCPTLLDIPDTGCYCFEIPDQNCETLLPDCEAIDKFYETYGTGAPAYYLSRNYEQDFTQDIGGPVGNGTMLNLVEGPEGDCTQLGFQPGATYGYDACGAKILTVVNSSTSPTSFITVRDIGNVNDMTMGLIIRPTSPSPPAGRYEIWGGRSGADSSIGYSIGWDWINGTLAVSEGFDLDPTRYVRLDFAGPLCRDINLDVHWTVLFVRVIRTESTFSAQATWINTRGYGSASGTTDRTEAGGLLSNQAWWTTANGQDNSFSIPTAGDFEAGSYTYLYSGFYQGIPAESYLRLLHNNLRRNSTDYDCEVDGPPPILPGSSPVYNLNTDAWELRPPLPGSTTTGLYLTSSQEAPYYAKWESLPIIGGTTGQQLVKNSNTDNDVVWVNRDAKTFLSSADPAGSETVLPGDFWYQGIIT